MPDVSYEVKLYEFKPVTLSFKVLQIVTSEKTSHVLSDQGKLYVWGEIGPDNFKNTPEEIVS